MTADRRGGTAQLNKPQGSLPPWGVEARSSSCSIPDRAVGLIGKEDMVYCSVKDSLSISWREESLGARVWKGKGQ